MSRRLLISALPGETRAAWLEGARLSDLIVQRADRPSVADNLYLGRVRALDRGLEAAFVDIGLDRPGFLPLGEAPAHLSEGASIVVRVAREPAPDKGARLSARPGTLAPEVAALARRARPPALLRAADDPIAAALEAGAVEVLVVDDPGTFQRLRQALEGRSASPGALRLDLDPRPLFEREGVEAEIEALLEPRVALPSGGALLVEPVRTLSAIDVDAGRHGGRGGATAQALAVNLEAAQEIARQIRLRNLSGLIVIDFLPLADAGARRQVVAALRRPLASDPQPVRVQPMRASGLVEMTRRRARAPLHELLSEPCGLGGGGRVKDPVTLAYEALRRARAMAARGPGRRLIVRAPARIIGALEGPAAPARAALEARLGRPLELRGEAGREDVEIVLE